MEEDSWLCIEDDDDNYHSATDSDVIDSETEAELYSTIHYEQKLIPNSTLFTSIKNSCPKEKKENIKTERSIALKPGTNDHDTLHYKNNSDDRNGKAKNTSNSTKKCKSDSVQSIDLCTSSSETESSIVQHKNNSNDRNDKLKHDCNPPKICKLDSIQSNDLCSNNSEIKISFGSQGHIALNNVKNESTENSNDKSPMLNSTHSIKSNTSSICNSPVKRKKSKKIVMPIYDSSDSDSVIWQELDSIEKSDIKTNLKDNMGEISLSSESDDEDSPKNKVGRFLVGPHLRNMSMPNIKLGEESEGLWHINSEDLYRQKRSRRYHENFHKICSNCNRKGHSVKNCPSQTIKCFICGDSGHLGFHCINRLCGKCYNYGHSYRQCPLRQNYLFCALCCVKGHSQEVCPDLWRRYHLTTEPMKIIKAKKLKQDTDIYCWNCGEVGHFGGLCQYRFQGRLNTWPCVISYDDPRQFLRENDLKGGFNNLQSGQYINADVNAQGGIKERNYGAKEKRFGQKRKKKNNNLTLIEGNEKKGEMIQRIITQRNFPRTPKRKKPEWTNFNNPEEVDWRAKLREMKKLDKRNKYKIKRKAKRLQKRSEKKMRKLDRMKANIQSFQDM